MDLIFGFTCTTYSLYICACQLVFLPEHTNIPLGRFVVNEHTNLYLQGNFPHILFSVDLPTLTTGKFRTRLLIVTASFFLFNYNSVKGKFNMRQNLSLQPFIRQK